MPELPEVETLRRQLERAVKGRKIKNVEVRFGGRIRPSASALVGAATGATFKAFGRRAKLLLSHLSNGWTIVTHLKMTGSYLLKKAGTPPTKHVHVVTASEGGLRAAAADVIALAEAEEIGRAHV